MTLNFSGQFEGQMPTPESGEVPDALKCTTCGKLLFNAMLITECGCKFCERPCFQEVLQTKSCPGGTEDCGPFQNGLADKGTRRNILNLKVNCIYKCGHTGLFRDLSTHLETCPQYPINCEYCNQPFPRVNFKAHHQQCDKRRVDCDFCGESILWSDLEEHHDLRSSNCCAEYIGPCPYCHEPNVSKRNLLLHKQSCRKWPVECPFRGHGCMFAGGDLQQHLIEAVPQHQEILLNVAVRGNEKLKAENERLRGEIEKLTNNCHAFEQKAKDLSDEFEERWKKLRKVQTILANCREKQIDTEKIVERYGDIEELLNQFTNTSQSLTASSLSSRQQAIYTSNGLYMWKIDDYRAKRLQAKNGTSFAITSDPFFSEPYGYKMCCRVYLNGDGSGKGTHMSVFIVIMKSEYDSVLKWPFMNRVTFTLINQERGEHRVETFSPDQRSHSFKKPVEDKNIASGCPRFIHFQQLEGMDYRSPYLQEDTIFLKIQVDRTLPR